MSDKINRRALGTGLLLIAAAGVMVLIVLRFDAVFGAASTFVNACAPVFGGLVIAYILNVFVHFFEDLAFRRWTN